MFLEKKIRKTHVTQLYITNEDAVERFESEIKEPLEEIHFFKIATFITYRHDCLRRTKDANIINIPVGKYFFHVCFVIRGARCLLISSPGYIDY